MAVMPGGLAVAAARPATAWAARAGAQTDPAPGETSTTVRSTTTTVCVEPQPQFRFVGEVVGRQGDSIRFIVLAAPEGSPLPPEVTVLFPDQGRYLDDGSRYAVAAFSPPAEVEDAGGGSVPATAAPSDPAAPTPASPAAPGDPAATTAPSVGGLPPVLQGRVKLDDGQCGALTVHDDGKPVDTAVLKPLIDNWDRLGWSIVLPLVAALAVLTILVVVKRLVARVIFGPVGAPPPPRRRRRQRRPAGP